MGTARGTPSGAGHLTILLRAPEGGPAGPPPAPRRSPSADYDWPPSPALELWALRIRLEAACRKGEARQGWVSCRTLRKAIGVPRRAS